MKTSQSPFQWIVDKYPDTMSMEQMRLVCHISKRTARHLLEHNLVPCIASPKKTRRFTIKTEDVVYYLRRRELFPNDYLPPENWYGCKVKKKIPRTQQRHLSKPMQQRMVAFAPIYIEQYSDVLTVPDVMEITGYGKTAVCNWCSKNLLYSFRITNALHIPKISLLEFIQSEEFGGILPSSDMYTTYHKMDAPLKKVMFG